MCIYTIYQAIVLPVSHAKTAPKEDDEEGTDDEDDGGKYAELKLIELREMSIEDVPQKKGIAGW